MTEPILTVRRGESFEFEYKLPDETESTTNWTCTVIVRKTPSSDADVERVVAVDDDVWSGHITSSETAALDFDQYTILGLLQNSSTDEVIENNARFKVSESYSGIS